MYLHDWEESDFIGMVSDFEDNYITKAEYEAEECPYANKEYWLEKKAAMRDSLASDKWQNLKILLASYTNECYEGDAFVLFERDGKLFEVNGGHCSCFGLEGQWEPEETTKEALIHRLDKGDLGVSYWDKGNTFAEELRSVLDAI